jgi:NAD(P)-dependent dehydrogenase (short-subunit alcohol dehydrogenase family)
MTTALVVGAGPGLGRSIALAFAGPGDAVSLVARNPERVAAIADEVRGTGAQADTFTADVRDEAGLRTAIGESLARFGTPDVLVYNAAIIQWDVLGELDAAGQEQAWGVNVVGALTAASAVLPRMAERGSGSFLVTGGIPTPIPSYVSLSLGKAGVRAMTELLATQYGPAGVHVATVTVGGPVAPGTPLDPDAIATHYVRLHEQARGDWEREVLLHEAWAQDAQGPMPPTLSTAYRTR